MPSDWYRELGASGPAIRRGVTLCLKWAPFNARSPNDFYPNREEFKPLVPTRDTHFAPNESKRTLATGETFQAFTLDLRDWFNVEPGDYEFEVQVR